MRTQRLSPQERIIADGLDSISEEEAEARRQRGEAVRKAYWDKRRQHREQARAAHGVDGTLTAHLG